MLNLRRGLSALESDRDIVGFCGPRVLKAAPAHSPTHLQTTCQAEAEALVLKRWAGQPPCPQDTHSPVEERARTQCVTGNRRQGAPEEKGEHVQRVVDEQDPGPVRKCRQGIRAKILMFVTLPPGSVC